MRSFHCFELIWFGCQGPFRGPLVTATQNNGDRRVAHNAFAISSRPPCAGLLGTHLDLNFDHAYRSRGTYILAWFFQDPIPHHLVSFNLIQTLASKPRIVYAD